MSGERAAKGHGGHRKRLRERYRREGMDGFQPHEILELLLTYAIPRKNTNPMAHELIRKFGSLANVLEARQEQLMQVEGVGENAAAMISMMNDVSRQYRLSKFGDKVVLDSTEKLARYCMNLEFARPYETFFMICLNARKKVVGRFLLEEGTLDNTPVYISKIVERAMATKAYSVAFTHNHPGGVPEPSDNDVRATFLVSRALKTVDIRFEDHIIVGDEERWISMRESNFI